MATIEGISLNRNTVWDHRSRFWHPRPRWPWWTIIPQLRFNPSRLFFKNFGWYEDDVLPSDSVRHVRQTSDNCPFLMPASTQVALVNNTHPTASILPWPTFFRTMNAMLRARPSRRMSYRLTMSDICPTHDWQTSDTSRSKTEPGTFHSVDINTDNFFSSHPTKVVWSKFARYIQMKL